MYYSSVCFFFSSSRSLGFPGGSDGKASLSTMWETQVRSLGQEDPLEKEMTILSSSLAWRIPWTEEPSGLKSTRLQRVGPDRATTHTHAVSFGLPCSSAGNESAHIVGDLGSVPGPGRSPGGGHGNPLQYSCLEDPTDREAWEATDCGVTKSRTRLKRLGPWVCVLCFHLLCLLSLALPFWL